MLLLKMHSDTICGVLLMNNYSRSPLVTIITVSYNSVDSIERTIKSVITQSYKNIEYIIIDGASSDGTVDIIRKYGSHIAYWVSENDNGIYFAMNKGIRQSHGEYIGIINSDDWYEPDALQNVVNCFNENRDIDVVDGIVRVFNGNLPQFLKGNYFENLAFEMPPHPTCFIKREIYLKLGLYDETYKSAADYDFLLRCKLKGAKFLCLPHILANFQLGGMSSSLTSVTETVRIEKKYGFISIGKEILLLVAYHLRNLFRKACMSSKIF